MKENRRETLNCFHFGHKLMIKIFKNYIPVDVTFPHTEHFLSTVIIYYVQERILSAAECLNNKKEHTIIGVLKAIQLHTQWFREHIHFSRSMIIIHIMI